MVERSVGGRAAEVLEALVELLDATGRVHDALLARVERVRGGRDLDVDDGVFHTVELDRLVAGPRRTGEEGFARAEVAEHDGLVVGVDVSLHDGPLRGDALDFASAVKVCGASAPRIDLTSLDARMWNRGPA